MFVVALCYTLFVFVVTLLLHSIDVHRGPLAAHYWCSSSPPCCVFLVFVGAPLLHSIGACWRPLATPYWCLLAPPCCALLIPLWLILLINIPLLCSSVRFSRVLLVLFGIPNWYFHVAFFLQVCKFGSLSLFHSTSSNIHKQQGMFLCFLEFLWTIISLFFAISSLWIFYFFF
jgi:hypothetical protein